MSLFKTVDFKHFHETLLPQLLIGGYNRVAAADPVEVASLAIRHSQLGSYTYLPKDDGVTVIAGEEQAEIILELEDQTWQDFYYEIYTCVSLIISKRGHLVKGRADKFLHWEPRIRAMYFGRPIYNPTCVDLRTLTGEPLDLSKSFMMDSSAPEMANFLEQAGFLHVTDVFSAQEIETLRQETYRCRDAVAQGEKHTWWAENQKGEAILSRIQYINQRSEIIENALPNARIDRIVALGQPEYIPIKDRMDGVTALFKNYGMVKGLSDIPWYVDTGIGGYQMLSPMLLVNVYLEDGNAETGEVRIMPGSWKMSSHISAINTQQPQGVAVSAKAGDITLHYDNALHASMPPTKDTKGRVSLYIVYYDRKVLQFIPAGKSFNDIFEDKEGGVISPYAN